MQFYIPNNPLPKDQTILFKLGQLCYEDLNVRAKRFTLINLFTNHRYNKNTVIAQLVKKAYAFHRQDHDDWAKQSLDDAATLLERAKLEAPTLSKYRFIRWLKGSPLINIANLEARINQARQNMGFKAPAQAEAAEPIAFAGLIPTPQEVVDTLKQALAICPDNTLNHRKMLSKWIKLAEKREKLLAKAHELYTPMVPHSRSNAQLASYINRETGLSFYTSYNNPIQGITEAPQEYAVCFKAVQHDPMKRKQFFTQVFTGRLPCFAGNYKELAEWIATKMNALNKQMLVLDRSKDKAHHLAQLQEHLTRQAFTRYLQESKNEVFDAQNLEHEKLFGEFNAGANPAMEAFRGNHVTRQALIEVIKQANLLPLVGKDWELNMDNIAQEVDEFFNLLGE